MKRLLVYLADAFPQRNFLIIEDALTSNGPHTELLNTLKMSFVLGVKPEGNKILFKQVIQRQCDETLSEWQSEVAEDHSCHGYRFTNGLSLNDSYPDLWVNHIESWERDKNSKNGTAGPEHIIHLGDQYGGHDRQRPRYRSSGSESMAY